MLAYGKAGILQLFRAQKAALAATGNVV